MDIVSGSSVSRVIVGSPETGYKTFESVSELPPTDMSVYRASRHPVARWIRKVKSRFAKPHNTRKNRNNNDNNTWNTWDDNNTWNTWNDNSKSQNLTPKPGPYLPPLSR